MGLSLALALFSCATLVTALPKVLIFSRTLGFRHESIPTAISALESHGPDANIQFDATEDPTKFTDSNLAQYDGILFLMTTDSNDTTRIEVLDPDQKVCPLRSDVLSESIETLSQSAFLQYLSLGGNYIGVHSASDCLTATPWFGNETGASGAHVRNMLMRKAIPGAYFDYHPALQNGCVFPAPFSFNYP